MGRLFGVDPKALALSSFSAAGQTHAAPASAKAASGGDAGGGQGGGAVARAGGKGPDLFARLVTLMPPEDEGDEDDDLLVPFLSVPTITVMILCLDFLEMKNSVVDQYGLFPYNR